MYFCFAKNREYLNSVLPYSVGIEIECVRKNTFDSTNFKNIPYLLHFREGDEMAFRIPNGIKGMLCLYLICEQLKINNELNPLSGIHYHIDLTNMNRDKCLKHRNYILKELDSWGYNSTTNARDVVIDKKFNWVNIRSNFKTAEFRIGEMSFDYKFLLNRINHCSEIISKIYSNDNCEVQFDTNTDYNLFITYIKNVVSNNSKYNNLLKNLDVEKEESEINFNEIKNKIRNRVK